MEEKRRLREGRTTGKAINEYKVLRDKSSKLYDIATTTAEKLEQCETKFGMCMSVKDRQYLED